MEYEHKGVKIELDPVRASFSATINGQRKRAASLSAIKAQIDKAQGFEPFAALIPDLYDYTTGKPGMVNGIEKSRRDGPGVNWLTSKGMRPFVYVNSPETRAVLNECRAATEAERVRHDAEVDRIRKLRMTAKTLKPDMERAR